jgi:hypothetical protein
MSFIVFSGFIPGVARVVVTVLHMEALDIASKSLLPVLALKCVHAMPPSQFRSDRMLCGIKGQDEAEDE